MGRQRPRRRRDISAHCLDDPWVARSKEANLVIVAAVVWHLLPGEISLLGACNVQKEIMPAVRLRRLIDVLSFHICQIKQENQDPQALL